MKPDHLLILILAGCFAFPILLGVHRRREGIFHRLRRVLIVEACYLGVAALVIQASGQPAEGILAGLVAGLIADRFIAKRSRHVRNSERRKAIRRFESSTGTKYDRRRHDLHHDVAFSSGGSNTADNLRVLPRGENRRRGARAPWWDLLGRRR
jgi:hypothetical protein